MVLCTNGCKQRASYNTMLFGLISQLLIYTPAESFSADVPMSVPDTGLKIKTVQPETFCSQRQQRQLSQSLCLETESLPPLLLNRPGIFPQTGSSDVLPVIQVGFFQLLQTNSKKKTNQGHLDRSMI